jgi:16S rRNA (cytidine1402-2'-O)-methyltransferase
MPCPDPGLYIVATPIGNLRDITLRALDVLTHADIILAEDTRQTQKLLNAYNIRGTLTAYHDHNAAKRIPSVLKDLESGKIIVQVSDAGTPLVSDPGFKLVRAAAEAGYKITPVPGASALLAALTSAALPTDRFMFAGFLPSKSSARIKSLESLKMVPGTLVFFESAGRLNDSLEDILDVLGDRSAAIARELTKKYEETRRGKISALLQELAEDPARGEIVVVIGPSEAKDVWDEAEIDKALLANLKDMGVKRASAHIAEMSGWPKRDVYQRALSLS